MERLERQEEVIVLCFSMCVFVCAYMSMWSCTPHLMWMDYPETHRAATMPSSSRQQQSEVRLLGLSVCSEEASVKDSKLCVCALLVQLS